MRYPLLRYYLEKVLRDRGGISRTGPLRSVLKGLSKLPAAELSTYADQILKLAENLDDEKVHVSGVQSSAFFVC